MMGGDECGSKVVGGDDCQRWVDVTMVEGGLSVVRDGEMWVVVVIDGCRWWYSGRWL